MKILNTICKARLKRKIYKPQRPVMATAEMLYPDLFEHCKDFIAADRLYDFNRSIYTQDYTALIGMLEGFFSLYDVKLEGSYGYYDVLIAFYNANKKREQLRIIKFVTEL